MLASIENYPLLRDVAREERPEVKSGKWSKGDFVKLALIGIVLPLLMTGCSRKDGAVPDRKSNRLHVRRLRNFWHTIMTYGTHLRGPTGAKRGAEHSRTKQPPLRSHNPMLAPRFAGPQWAGWSHEGGLPFGA